MLQEKKDVVDGCDVNFEYSEVVVVVYVISQIGCFQIVDGGDNVYGDCQDLSVFCGVFYFVKNCGNEELEKKKKRSQFLLKVIDLFEFNRFIELVYLLLMMLKYVRVLR